MPTFNTRSFGLGFLGTIGVAILARIGWEIGGWICQVVERLI